LHDKQFRTSRGLLMFSSVMSSRGPRWVLFTLPMVAIGLPGCHFLSIVKPESTSAWAPPQVCVCVCVFQGDLRFLISNVRAKGKQSKTADEVGCPHQGSVRVYPSIDLLICLVLVGPFWAVPDPRGAGVWARRGPTFWLPLCSKGSLAQVA
jgi:hypothetical protein